MSAASKGGRPRGSTGIPRALPAEVRELRAFGLVTAAEVAKAVAADLGTVIRRLRQGDWPGYERPTTSDRYRFLVDLRALLALPTTIPDTPSTERLRTLEASLPTADGVKPIPSSFIRLGPASEPQT